MNAHYCLTGMSLCLGIGVAEKHKTIFQSEFHISLFVIVLMFKFYTQDKLGYSYLRSTRTICNNQMR